MAHTDIDHILVLEYTTSLVLSLPIECYYDLFEFCKFNDFSSFLFKEYRNPTTSPCHAKNICGYGILEVIAAKFSFHSFGFATAYLTVEKPKPGDNSRRTATSENHVAIKSSSSV